MVIFYYFLQKYLCQENVGQIVNEKGIKVYRKQREGNPRLAVEVTSKLASKSQCKNLFLSSLSCAMAKVVAIG